MLLISETMGRVHKKKIGVRRYMSCPPELLDRVVQDIRDGKISINRASQTYNIPKSTLSRKKRDVNKKKVGRPCVLSEDEEKQLSDGIMLACEWGFPLTCLDIRLIVKGYLDRKGRHETIFKNNLPGEDWMRGFLSRNPVLSERLAQNIKRARAEVDVSTMSEYFQELEKSLEGVDPSLMVNYDETNITDDPGRKKIVTRRGCKHPDMIVDSSKSSVSVMFSGTASGKLLPPYVCYKAEHLYDTWMTGGPNNCRYNRSKNGWFNSEIFEDWFNTIALPFFKKAPLESPKLLIGDNLASHVSLKVIKDCQLYNIRFVLMPPNSTNLCQPLDVAYFRPLKMKWREVLLAWKMKNRGCIPKDRFPMLLRKCLQNLDDDGKNLRSGFKATGIHPFCPSEVLKRMPHCNSPSAQASSGEIWKESFKAYLDETRKSETVCIRKKKKKVMVKPGRSLCYNDSQDEDEAAQEDEVDENTVDDPDTVIQDSSSDDNENCDESDNDSMNANDENNESKTNMIDENVKENLKVGNYVSVQLVYGMGRNKSTMKSFGAKVLSIKSDNIQLKFLRQSTKASNIYMFPEIDDISTVKRHQIKAILTPIFERRGRICLPLEK